MRKNLFIINLIVSVVLVILTGIYAMNKFGMYENQTDCKKVSFYVSAEKNSKSYGHEARIVNIKINGENIDLSKIQNAEWVWHAEWGYILYQGEGNSYLDFEYDERISDLSVEYIKEPGSGVLYAYCGDTAFLKGDMYRKTWKNCNAKYSVVTSFQKYFFLAELVVLLTMVVSCLEWIFIFLRRQGKPNTKTSIGFKTFDFAKGIGMLLIIGGHSAEAVLEDSLFSRIAGWSSILLFILAIISIYSLMPMFLVISGMGFRKNNISTTVKKQLGFWVKPYLIVTAGVLFVCTFRLAFERDFTLETFGYFILPLVTLCAHTGTFAGIIVNSIGPMWFGTALCFAWIIMNAIECIPNKYVKCIVYAFICILGCFVGSHDIMILCIPQTIFAVLILKVGALIKEYKVFQTESYKTIAFYILCLLGLIIVGTINGATFSIAVSQWGSYYILALIASVFGGIVITRLSISINKALTGKCKIIKTIGFNSYYIFYIHTFEYLAIPWDKLALYIPGGTLAKWIIITALRALVIYVIYISIEKIKKYRWKRS